MAGFAAFLLGIGNKTYEIIECFLCKNAADCCGNAEQKIMPRLWIWLQKQGCSAHNNHRENAEETATFAMRFDCLQGGKGVCQQGCSLHTSI